MSKDSSPEHIIVTETLVRLYVFLAQFLDRCVDESARQAFPQQELQGHLAKTRATLMDILSVNPVVKNKVGVECDRIMALSEACLQQTAPDLAELKRERTVLQNKTIALSDLLAVFRAMD